MNLARFYQTLDETTGGHKSYWYPLFPLEQEIPALAYDIGHCDTVHLMEQLSALLTELDIRQVFDVCRDRDTVETIPDLPAYVTARDETGALDLPWYMEHYYFDETRCWMIYVSHEGTMTLAGEVLCQKALEHLEERPAASTLPAVPLRKYPCPCCGCKTFPAPAADAVAYICPVCMWENDVFTASDDEPSDENHGLTLDQGRKHYKTFGVCDLRLAQYARKPLPEERNEAEL